MLLHVSFSILQRRSVQDLDLFTALLYSDGLDVEGALRRGCERVEPTLPFEDFDKTLWPNTGDLRWFEDFWGLILKSLIKVLGWIAEVVWWTLRWVLANFRLKVRSSSVWWAWMVYNMDCMCSVVWGNTCSCPSHGWTAAGHCWIPSLSAETQGPRGAPWSWGLVSLGNSMQCCNTTYSLLKFDLYLSASL